MSAPYFPIELKDINAEITFLGMGNKNYSIGTVNITTCAQPSESGRGL